MSRQTTIRRASSGTDVYSSSDPNLNGQAATFIGNAIINNNQTYLDQNPNSSGAAIDLLMYWDQYIDWTDAGNQQAVCDLDQTGVLRLKPTKKIVEALGQPTHWYEGAPKAFIKDKVGGVDLVPNGDLKTYTPKPTQLGVQLNNPKIT